MSQVFCLRQVHTHYAWWNWTRALLNNKIALTATSQRWHDTLHHRCEQTAFAGWWAQKKTIMQREDIKEENANGSNVGKKKSVAGPAVPQELCCRKGALLRGDKIKGDLAYNSPQYLHTSQRHTSALTGCMSTAFCFSLLPSSLSPSSFHPFPL